MGEKYYLGLDIGTDSVGYAVTDEYYQLKKRKGEPVIGVTTFEAGEQAATRRAFRTARRRYDRRQQRIALLNDIFASEIGKIDPRFFIRRSESRLFRDDTEDNYTVFDDAGFTDREYYQKYPTIHHLIYELMSSNEAHDIRLVYIACAWLIANRGHFLFDVAADEVYKLLDFGVVYNDFCEFFRINDMLLPWDVETKPDDILEILKMNAGVRKKQDAFKERIFHGEKIPKEINERYSYNRDAVIALLCGSKIKPEEVYRTGEFEDIDSVALGMDDESFSRIMGELGDSAELFIRLRAVHDCALLIVAQNGKASISEAKIGVYQQHRQDLKALKKFVRRYIPNDYDEIFRAAEKGIANYVSYSYNLKSCPKSTDVTKSNAEAFSTYLKKKVKDIHVEKDDMAFYQDMLTRLDTFTFLPKQKTTDNRVIPQQLYRYELSKILDNAEATLPMLHRVDGDGITNKQKILSIFDFRIPYFVGPLRQENDPKRNHAWIERKAQGKIYPWNFEEMVDFDKSEQAFIRRMTNTCTYVAGAPVLPVKSLLYCKYTVLNEINNLKINGNAIPVEVKQSIFTDLFMEKQHVTLKQIKDYLARKGLLFPEDEISGVDIKINSSLASYHQFKRLLLSNTLSEADVENIIEHSAYSEDRKRMAVWLKSNYAALSDSDVKYITRLNLKEFGRLSHAFLVDTIGADCETGEAFSIIDALWSTNNNLMQLLSSRFTFTSEIEKTNSAYYTEHPANLSQRLDDMYISNAVKRPIIRTLDICRDVVKAMGYPPTKIFVEMARGASENQKGKRTQTRKQQLLELYKKIKTDEARALEKALSDMGVMADNRLQADALFLYYLQMGKCAYTGKAIDLTHLTDGTYNIDHIYPRAFVKDDSVINNKVLVCSKVNAEKTNEYPISADIRSKMRGTWDYWHANGLLTDEKYNRLIRSTKFTDDEKWSFINRQLVETRQSTKAVATLLGELYPDARIVYVKAGLVSEFRQEFDMLKSRSVNNLHHAKDAYLNIVVGNVYDSRFSKHWFDISDNYSISVKKIFSKPVKCGNSVIWQGDCDLAKVRSVMNKNAIHVTRFSFARKGGFFDIQPVKAAPGLVPLKKDLPTEKYGGYNKPTASFFSLVKYNDGKKTDIMFMPIELLYADKYLKDKDFALEYAMKTISSIVGRPVTNIEQMLNGRPIKVNTMLSVDGLRLVINGKSGGGKSIIVALASQLILPYSQEKYIKALEAFISKKATNSYILPDKEHDHITAEDNLALYDVLLGKMRNTTYIRCPGNQAKTLFDGRDKFITLSLTEQISCLLNIISWFGPSSGGCDLKAINGAGRAGTKYPTSTLSAWKKNYSDVRIVDLSSSGIYASYSENLLNL